MKYIILIIFLVFSCTNIPDIVGDKYSADVNVTGYSQSTYLKVDYEIVNTGDSDIHYYNLVFEAQTTNGNYENFCQGSALLIGRTINTYMYISNGNHLCTNIILKRKILDIGEL
jgi:hypothetical protein